MWNSFDTGAYQGMIAETVTAPGHDGKMIPMYYARPLHRSDYPSIVLIPHLPGWDEYCFEASRRFAQHGYAVMCPDIYADYGHGKPEEVAQRAQDAGFVHDDKVMEDVKGALDFLKLQPQSNGKCGVIGMCSGGRHAFLAACTVDGFDCAVDCWGGHMNTPKEDLTPARPVAPIDYTDKLQIPLLGIFGNEDENPSRADVDLLESKLKEGNKQYEFHRYDGAGHGIWYYNYGCYRQEQAMDSFEKVMTFFERHLKNA